MHTFLVLLCARGSVHFWCLHTAMATRDHLPSPGSQIVGSESEAALALGRQPLKLRTRVCKEDAEPLLSTSRLCYSASVLFWGDGGGVCAHPAVLRLKELYVEPGSAVCKASASTTEFSLRPAILPFTLLLRTSLLAHTIWNQALPPPLNISWPSSELRGRNVLHSDSSGDFDPWS